jgi:GNAT superfamily N-acetyltransferase
MHALGRHSADHPSAPQVRVLEKEAFERGFRFLTRLIAEWNSGENCFNVSGECLMAGYRNQHLIGIGGLSVDACAEKNMGRLRRVYVSAASRGHHVGQTLVSHAALRFQDVCLFTDTADGDAFYMKCGFTRTERDHSTQVMRLSYS